MKRILLLTALSLTLLPAISISTTPPQKKCRLQDRFKITFPSKGFRFATHTKNKKKIVKVDTCGYTFMPNELITYSDYIKMSSKLQQLIEFLVHSKSGFLVPQS